MRVALISPRGPLYRFDGIWKKSLRYQPLTLTTLAALIPDDLNVDLTVMDEGIMPIDTSLDFDLVAISIITGSANRGYEIADEYRSRNIPVVIGGVHVTLHPEDAKPHADTIVEGYAEKTWPQLLRDFSKGKMKKRYIQDTCKRCEISVPIARRELLPADKYVTPHTMEATRGCPHNCEFCVVPSAWKGFYTRPVQDVVDEIKYMEAKRVLFLDLNLIGDETYAKELFTALIPLNIEWGGLTTTKVTWDGELYSLLVKSGCKGLLLGLESTQSESNLETYKGFNNMTDYHKTIKTLHDNDIAIMGCFAMGFDHDNTESFQKTVDFIMQTGIDLPRFAIVTPFPGTALNKRLKEEGRIITEDWDLYDVQHVVFQPKNFTPEELAKNTEKIWREVYKTKNIIKRFNTSGNWTLYGLGANLGYQYYAKNLHKYYACEVTPTVIKGNK